MTLAADMAWAGGSLGGVRVAPCACVQVAKGAERGYNRVSLLGPIKMNIGRGNLLGLFLKVCYSIMDTAIPELLEWSATRCSSPFW
jgi:hypothetical protein